MLIVGHGFLTYSSRFSLHDRVCGKYNDISELGHTTEGDKMKVILPVNVATPHRMVP